MYVAVPVCEELDANQKVLRLNDTQQEAVTGTSSAGEVVAPGLPVEWCIVVTLTHLHSWPWLVAGESECWLGAAHCVDHDLHR